MKTRLLTKTGGMKQRNSRTRLWLRHNKLVLVTDGFIRHEYSNNFFFLHVIDAECFWDTGPIFLYFGFLGSNEHSDGAKHGINFYSSIRRSALSETGRLCKDTGQPWAFYLMGQGVGLRALR